MCVCTRLCICVCVCVQEYQKIVDAEWTILYNKLEKIVSCGAKVVLSKLPIGDVATQYFADRCVCVCVSKHLLSLSFNFFKILLIGISCRDVFCAGRVVDEDLQRTMKACGGAIQTSVGSLTDDVLGTCQIFQEEQIGGERLEHNLLPLFKGLFLSPYLNQ